jgi:hypothetical protein
MKKTLMVAMAVGFLGLASAARAADEPKPDCSEQQKALDDAKGTEKTAGKADVSSCKDMKGQEKKDCENPIKEKAKADEKAAKESVKAAKTALDCCKKPDKKGCAP